MPVFNFTITRYDPAEPWVILSTGRDAVELDDGEDFTAWAKRTYPDAVVRIEPRPLEPWG